jgi:MarR family transcriptional regulator, organic hydroperoxide resistance regulator
VPESNPQSIDRRSFLKLSSLETRGYANEERRRILAQQAEAALPSQSIAQYMVARDPDITRLVDRLQKDRSIERERDEQDRRIIRVRVTQSGLDAIEKLDPLIWKFHQQQLGHLSQEKLELLNQLLVEARLKP